MIQDLQYIIDEIEMRRLQAQTISDETYDSAFTDGEVVAYEIVLRLLRSHQERQKRH